MTTQAIQHPAIAVDDGRIVRLGNPRPVDQRQGFAIAGGAVGQDVAQRIERGGTFRLLHQQRLQVGFGTYHIVLLLPVQAARIQQRRLAGKGRQGAGQCLQLIARITQQAMQLGFGQVGITADFPVHQHIVLQRARGLQGLLRAPHMVQHADGAQLRLAALGTIGHRPVPG